MATNERALSGEVTEGLTLTLQINRSLESADDGSSDILKRIEESDLVYLPVPACLYSQKHTTLRSAVLSNVYEEFSHGTRISKVV